MIVRMLLVAKTPFPSELYISEVQLWPFLRMCSRKLALKIPEIMVECLLLSNDNNCTFVIVYYAEAAHKRYIKQHNIQKKDKNTVL